MTEDRGSAFVFTSFEEAYGAGGQAVASAWSRGRILAIGTLEADASHVWKVSAETMKTVNLTRRQQAEDNKLKQLICGLVVVVVLAHSHPVH